jgi:glutamyl/glutaminyl-tRNA synthetase
MTIQDILSTNLEFTGKPAFKIVKEKVDSALQLVFSHYSYKHNRFEWIEYHRTVGAANQLVRAVNELIDPLYKENRDIEEEYRSLKSGNNSEKAPRTINLTIEKLIDKSLELGSLVGLFEILSKNKQLDKKEVVKAILSRITDQKLEQLEEEKIKSYSQSVDDYLGVTTDAQKKDSFINAINGKREEIKRNNKESMQRILFGDGNNNNVSKNIELFKTSIMTSLTKEQVIKCLLEAKSPEEIKELNQLLPQDLE